MTDLKADRNLYFQIHAKHMRLSYCCYIPPEPITREVWKYTQDGFGLWKEPDLDEDC